MAGIERSTIKPPSTLLALAEGWRALAEASTLLPSIPWLDRMPRGDGHTVYVLPGFMADNRSTRMLCRWLDRLGYRVSPWGFGRNLGPRGDLHARIVDEVTALSRESGGPLSLIGQSLGGVYAREVAKAAPECVRQVITLGSPFGQVHANGTYPAVLRLFEMASGEPIEALSDKLLELPKPPPVPSTAIFSRTDGVTDWKACIEEERPHTDNVEVFASHCGMGFNPVIYYVIADRLSQPLGAWQKFDRGGMRGLLFPSAVYAA
jgi:pimeloyl-ACP methyl ester carboxylesterase